MVCPEDRTPPGSALKGWKRKAKAHLWSTAPAPLGFQQSKELSHDLTAPFLSSPWSNSNYLSAKEKKIRKKDVPLDCSSTV